MKYEVAQDLSCGAAAQCGAIAMALHAVTPGVEASIRRIYGQTAGEQLARAREALDAFYATMSGFL